jgi:hypothetical protein
MEEMEKSLRVGLAKVFEHYPRCTMLTGIFSAAEGKKLTFEFLVAGEEKARLRLRIPPQEFLKAAIPAWRADFEGHHGVKPAFVMEWLLDERVIRQGVGALASEIARQIVEKAKSQKTTHHDWIDYDLRTLKASEDNL